MPPPNKKEVFVKAADFYSCCGQRVQSGREVGLEGYGWTMAAAGAVGSGLAD